MKFIGTMSHLNDYIYVCVKCKNYLQHCNCKDKKRLLKNELEALKKSQEFKCIGTMSHSDDYQYLCKQCKNYLQYCNCKEKKRILVNELEKKE